MGWSGGAKVLGKLPVPGRPTNLITVEQGPIALAVGAGGGCLDIFSLIYHFSFFSPSLWETARYRLKYCLKGPLSQNNQPTNFNGCQTCGKHASHNSSEFAYQSFNHSFNHLIRYKMVRSTSSSYTIKQREIA